MTVIASDVSTSFTWHDQARIVAPDGSKPSDPASEAISSASSEVCLISDADPVTAIHQIFRACEEGVEFSVVTEVMAGKKSKARTDDDATPYFQCMSSGTTGQPKNIRRTHLSWIRSFEINAASFNLTPTDSYGILGRLSHSLALYSVMEAAHIGADIHILAQLRPDRQIKALAAKETTVLYATPTQLRLLFSAEKLLRPQVLPAVRFIFCGGGNLDQATRENAAALFPNAALHEFYGASETSFITIADVETPVGSVGKAYPGVTVEIRQKEMALKNGVGEVWVKSPFLFDGYGQGDSEDTVWQDGFLSVGEMGWLDDMGNLFIAGRKNRMVTIADQNAFPEEIEKFLLSDPAVPHCCVLPRPDAKRGNVFVAIVAGNENAETRDRLIRLCRQNLGPLKAPRKIIFLPDFPLLSSGKPDLPSIRKIVGGTL
ncbi:AMP-binding protein [Pseudohalocynthiibacter aestuariivivens]|uniref:AMP-binding protein n=1 Tax=Pseudohalocynthiibacter aestuariivivens TaxID=1591409 RepID=A0ABV5JF28_9RHOB|nr:AMP-binding protein [Pseudohalocynthiibacter aestuariivivens]MBS9717914.1 AMP-binding protein [Pseudohalocynthiibacter aestuariivivens]